MGGGKVNLETRSASSPTTMSRSSMRTQVSLALLNKR